MVLHTNVQRQPACVYQSERKHSALKKCSGINCYCKQPQKNSQHVFCDS